MNDDLLIYLAHALFWAAFGLTRAWVAKRDAAGSTTAREGPSASVAQAAPHAKALVAFHSVGFGFVYFGLGAAVFGHMVPQRYAGQVPIGAALIAAGAAVSCWALFWFSSWRLSAELDAGHQLATGGPFRFVRHPIYLGLNLLALGTWIWMPTALIGLATLVLWLGSDLRARAEEKLLTRAFGATYEDYCRHTRRFVPGIY